MVERMILAVLRSRLPCVLAALFSLLFMSLFVGCVADEVGNPRRVPTGYTGSFTSWWSDTKIREQGTYKDGQRNGEVTVWHADGTLAEEGKFILGVPTGVHRVYHPGGVLAMQETAVDGVVDGQRLEFDSLGRPVAIQTYRAGKRDGEQRTFQPDGSVAREGAWKNDLPVGRWTSFGPKRQLVSIEWFWAAEGAPVGYLETVYSPDGRVTAQAIKSLKDGHWSGYRTYWHKNGVQAGLVDYRDDHRSGRDLAWSESGLLRVEGQREEDRRVGRWRTFDEHGELVEEREHGTPAEEPGSAP